MGIAVDLKSKPTVKDEQPFAASELEEFRCEHAASPTTCDDPAKPPEFTVDEAASELPYVVIWADKLRRQIFLARQVLERDRPPLA